MKKFFIAAVILFISVRISYSQNVNSFSVAGGPIFGWNVPQLSDLNDELERLGIPKLSTSGNFMIGGGGFIDVPMIKGFRVGGFGMGYSADESATLQNTIKAVNVSYSMGGISLEYVRKISDDFDYSLGGSLGAGTYKIKFSQFAKDMGNWNPGIFSGDTVSGNTSVSSEYSNTHFFVQPQVGLGYHILKFVYLKLNVGYEFTVGKTWKLNDAMEVENVPTGIKADGFNFSLGVNVGLFFK